MKGDVNTICNAFGDHLKVFNLTNEETDGKTETENETLNDDKYFQRKSYYYSWSSCGYTQNKFKQWPVYEIEHRSLYSSMTQAPTYYSHNITYYKVDTVSLIPVSHAIDAYLQSLV